MTVLAAILWLWLAASIGVYGFRIYRRVTNGPRTSESGPKSDAKKDGAKTDASGTLGAASALIQNPVAGFETPDAPAAPMPIDHPAPVDAPVTSSIAPTVDAPAVPPVLSTPPTPNHPDPQIPPAWSGAAPGDLPASERRAPRRPVSEAVEGIRLPCNLGPLVGDVSRLDPFDVSFFTTTHDGDSVRGALAGELVRLGFQVATTSPYRLSASSTTSDLVVTIYPNPTTATEGGRPLFPSAGTDSVVVRFQA